MNLGTGSQPAVVRSLSSYRLPCLHEFIPSSKAGVNLFSILSSLSNILSCKPKVPPRLLVEAELRSCVPSPQLQIHPCKHEGELEHCLLAHFKSPVSVSFLLLVWQVRSCLEKLARGLSLNNEPRVTGRDLLEELGWELSGT